MPMKLGMDILHMDVVAMHLAMARHRHGLYKKTGCCRMTSNSCCRVTWKLTDIDYPACLSHVEFDYYDAVYNESISKQANYNPQQYL